MFSSFIQPDKMDCGPACLCMISEHYGRRISLPEMRKMSFSTREGTSILGLSGAAEALGFHSQGVKLTWEQFRDEASLPCIVHWNQNHFIVAYKITKRHGKWYIYVSDPATGHLRYTKEMFLKYWLGIKGTDGKPDKGVALLLEPTPTFYEQKEGESGKKCNKFTLHHLLKYLNPHRQNIIQIFLAMIVASLLSLLLPFITQSVVDQGVALGKLGLVKTMLIAQLLIIVGQLANNLIRNWLMLHMTARVSISLISDFLAKLMRLPISFFDTKIIGDIMQRIQDHGRIQDFLTNSLLSIIMAVVLIIIYGAILGVTIYGYSVFL